MKTLATFLEKFSSSSVLGGHLSNNRGLCENFENQVLEWLFCRKNDDNSPFQVVSDGVDLSTYETFAHVAALLCMQNNDSHKDTEIASTFSGMFKCYSQITLCFM